MEKADEISDKNHGESMLTNSANDVTTIAKNRTRENKRQRTSETSNLGNAGSSYNAENHASGDADDDTRLRNVEELAGDVEKSSLSSDDYENSKVCVGNQKEIVTRGQKKDVGINSDGGHLPQDSSKPSELNVNETNHADDSDESEAVEQDVKVCDICGDAGREDLLAICFRCIDGAEHTYCMRVMIDQVPEGDWLCEECRLVEDNKNTNQQKCGSETRIEKDLSSEEPRASKDHSVVRVSGKRRAEESESSSSVKKQALETITGKLKPSQLISSDSIFGNESTESARSPAARPRLQSLKGGFLKSNSFNYPNAGSKTKLVDEIFLQRQKSTKERTSHDTVVAREMGKSMSFRSTNFGRFGASGSKVKMLSPKSTHVQDLKSLKNKKERIFERTNSVKSTSSSSGLTPKGDKLQVSRGENTTASSAYNSEVKPLKGDSKTVAGLKSTSRSSNVGAEFPVSPGQVNKQLPSSPHEVGAASSSGIISSIEQKSIALKEDNSSKLAIIKESTNIADEIKETSTTSVSCQNNKQTADRSGTFGVSSSAMRSSKEVKNRDNNKLKDAIEAALLKKPGIYRKNKVSDQSDESSVSSMNNDTVAFVDRMPHLRNAGNLTSAEVSISRSSNVDHSKQSNGKHFPTELSSHDDVALSLSKTPAIPDHEYIWQGSFEISRSGKTAEFWDGLQAHMSTCASPRVFEAVNNLPRKILLNGVSRISAWPTQFENSGVKEDNIALYFFAKDVESYEKSYQVLLDDMIKGDLALIGSINGVELLIFPSNQLPEKSHRWNMFFFLWGVLRGKKKNSSHQVPNNFPEKNGIPQIASSISTDKMLLTEGSGSLGSIDKDKHVESEPKDNLKMQNSSQEKPIDSVNVVIPASNTETLSLKPVTDGNSSVPNKSDDSQDVVKTSTNHKIDQGPSVELNHLPNEPKKRQFIDLSKDDDDEEDDEDDASKKQKIGDLNSCSENNTGAGNGSNGEGYFFPIIGSSSVTETPKVKFDYDLNEDISCLDRETDNIIIMEKKEDNADVVVVDDDDVSSSLSLSLAFIPPNKNEDDDRAAKGKCHSSPPSMLLFRDIVDK